jgi:hypothetical protein
MTRLTCPLTPAPQLFTTWLKPIMQSWHFI